MCIYIYTYKIVYIYIYLQNPRFEMIMFLWKPMDFHCFLHICGYWILMARRGLLKMTCCWSGSVILSWMRSNPVTRRTTTYFQAIRQYHHFLVAHLRKSSQAVPYHYPLTLSISYCEIDYNNFHIINQTPLTISSTYSSQRFWNAFDLPCAPSHPRSFFGCSLCCPTAAAGWDVVEAFLSSSVVLPAGSVAAKLLKEFLWYGGFLK